eukprot:gene5673-7059_t
MVLAELGNQISSALRAMNNSTIVNEETVNNLLKEVGNALLKADVSLSLVVQMRKSIQSKIKLDQMAAGINKRKFIRTVVSEELVKLVDPGIPSWKPVKGKSNIVMFVGLQGAGKTTSVTKLAYYYKRKGWTTSLVCADTFRAGAYAQLKHNATKAKIPYYGSETEQDPVAVAKKGVDIFKEERTEIIIVDTSGRNKQEAELFEEMKQIEKVIKPDNIIFVMDGSIGQAAYDQAAAFKSSVSVGSVIITKMDSPNSKGGGALSAVAATKSPIIFIGSGEHIPYFELFDPKAFIGKLLGEGNMKEVFETIKEVIPDDPSSFKALQTGKYTLGDMKQHFLQILKIGPIDKFVQNFPGFNNMPQLQGDAGNMKLKVYINICDSMSKAELDGKTPITPNRIIRIAQGSGRHPREVCELLEQYKVYKKMIENGIGKQPPNLRNMDQITKMVPPQLMKQMGGAGALQSMLGSLKNMNPKNMDIGKLTSQLGNLGGFGGFGMD